MKVLFLVIYMSQAFSGTHNLPVTQKVVSSAEHAAVLLWERKISVSYPEPEHYEGHLYEIDLSTMTIKEIPIFEIKFQTKKE